jgi:large subunit ribosomal protein L25
MVLKATKRSEIGSRKVARLRKSGQVPAIIYGHGEDPLAVAMGEHDLELAMQHGQRLLELDVDGQTLNVLIKDVQYDTYGKEVLHADLSRVNLDERVEVTVAIHYRGTPVGVTNEDGVFTPIIDEVSVECQVNNIPEEIVIGIHEMHVDDQLMMGDLQMPEGVKLLDEPETVIATVSVMAEEEEAAEGEEGSAEPEVIGAKEEEEQEG